ncbi:unnamed protein product [Bemisia tabaci]|uniref:SIFamide n=1 Tax=Bemisia tabaci TaxID=7038 RepID=A0A9P0CCQ5_BEMTA|nr:unnamed protein product [Bemisia tabaci]
MKRGSGFYFRAVLVLLFLMHISLTTARKPPLNGSIFGKRVSTIEYDVGKTLSAVCEVAVEACSSWFPEEENK